MMSRRGLISLIAMVMLAAFAFASPMPQNPQQSSSPTQDPATTKTTKSDKHDHSMKNQSDSATTQSTTSSTLGSDDRNFIMEAAHGGRMEVKMGRLAADKATNPDVKQFAQRMVDDHSKANSELMALASQKGITLPGAADMAMTNQDSASNLSSTTAQSGDPQSNPASATSAQQSSATSSTTDQKSSASSTPTDQKSSMDTTAGQRHARVDVNTGETMKDQEHANKLMSLSGDAFDREYMNMMVKDHEKAVKDFEKVSMKAKDTDVRAFAAKTLPTLREHLQQAREIQSRVKPAKNASSTNKTSGQ